MQTSMLSITLFLVAASAMPQLAVRSDEPSPYSSDATAPYNEWRPAYVDECKLQVLDYLVRCSNMLQSADLVLC